MKYKKILYPTVFLLLIALTIGTIVSQNESFSAEGFADFVSAANLKYMVGAALSMLRRVGFSFGGAGLATGFSVWQAAVLAIAIALLLALDALHECGRTLAGANAVLPSPARAALSLLAVLLIVVFGIWGPGYDAQAFIYFQF